MFAQASTSNSIRHTVVQVRVAMVVPGTFRVEELVVEARPLGAADLLVAVLRRDLRLVMEEEEEVHREERRFRLTRRSSFTSVSRDKGMPYRSVPYFFFFAILTC